MRGEFESSVVCLFVLFIYVLPQFVEEKLTIEIPSVLEIVIFVFVFAAEILGEMQTTSSNTSIGTPYCTRPPASSSPPWASPWWTCSTRVRT